jgi:hypothetical protein
MKKDKHPFSSRNNMQQQFFKIFSKTSKQISITPGANHLWIKGIQVYFLKRVRSSSKGAYDL